MAPLPPLLTVVVVVVAAAAEVPYEAAGFMDIAVPVRDPQICKHPTEREREREIYNGGEAEGEGGEEEGWLWLWGMFMAFLWGWGGDFSVKACSGKGSQLNIFAEPMPTRSSSSMPSQSFPFQVINNFFFKKNPLFYYIKIDLTVMDVIKSQ